MKKLVFVPHNGRELKFCSVEFPRGDCRGDYVSIKPQIESNGLRLPTISEIVSLIHTVLMNPKNYDFSKYDGQCEDDKEWKLHHILYSGWVIGFTGNLIVPKHGIYIQDNPPLKNNRLQMNKDKLHEMLIREEKGVVYSGDGNVRFAPWDNIPRGIDNFSSKNNAHLIGLVGEEGRLKLEELAKKYSLEGFINGNKRLKKPVIGRSSVQAYGRSFIGIPKDTLRDAPGAYMYEKGCIDLNPAGNLDSRPFDGAGSSYGIEP